MFNGLVYRIHVKILVPNLSVYGNILFLWHLDYLIYIVSTHAHAVRQTIEYTDQVRFTQSFDT